MLLSHRKLGTSISEAFKRGSLFHRSLFDVSFVRGSPKSIGYPRTTVSRWPSYQALVSRWRTVACQVCRDLRYHFKYALL